MSRFRNRYSGSSRVKQTGKAKGLDEVLREVREHRTLSGNYRERSLQLHGLICAKCGREFDSKNRHLLTVHHKDGNPKNNPSDGSNWENLCVWCHDDEHSRGVLADTISDPDLP
jgi:5-methylcytosine-specific restriction endonuclease McrA